MMTYEFDFKLLEGKAALVHGASSGVGKASALAHARAGAKVMCVARNEEKLAAVVSEIEAAGGVAAYTTAEIADEAQIEAMVATTIETFGSIDCVHVTTGFHSDPYPIQDFPGDILQRSLDLNFIGQAYIVKHVGRQMLRQDEGGSIVLTAAGAGIIGWPDSAGYTGGKAACNVLAQTAALDFMKAGATSIRVNTICPGGIRTPMMDHFKETMPDIAAKALGGGRMAEPEEQANAAVLLNSPLASCVNGVNLRTDCGYLAGSWLV
mgnify:CR=1 FL=1